MPFLSTPNAFLEQSSLLLEAYPDDTRITTKYTYPSSSSSSKANNKISKQTATTTQDSTTTTPIATLTLKTFNPVTGICLKYRTNKAAEVGRLVSGLGKLAAGTKIEPSTSLAAAAGLGDESAAVPGSAGDVEMLDAPAASAAPGVGVGGGAGGGGGKKKKGGKGKK